MKFLIWFLCIFANALITTLIKEAGVILGAIPTVILFSATIWLAQKLCKKWDEHKEDKEAARKPQSHPAPQPKVLCNSNPEDQINDIPAERACGNSEAAPKASHVRPISDNGKFVCPFCGQRQPSNRKKCWNCGVDFDAD